MVTMHMRLLNQDPDTRRPVVVTPLEGAVYRVEGPMPANEEWEFAPGTLVTVRWETFGKEQRLVPTGVAVTSITAAFVNHYKRMAGLLPPPLIFSVAVSEWLPRSPEGHLEPLPMFVASAAMVMVSSVAMAWLNPRSLTGKWMLRSALGFGILFCFASLLLGA